jgi:hypothetical protein
MPFIIFQHHVSQFLFHDNFSNLSGTVVEMLLDNKKIKTLSFQSRTRKSGNKNSYLCKFLLPYANFFRYLNWGIFYILLVVETETCWLKVFSVCEIPVQHLPQKWQLCEDGKGIENFLSQKGISFKIPTRVSVVLLLLWKVLRFRNNFISMEWFLGYVLSDSLPIVSGWSIFEMVFSSRKSNEFVLVQFMLLWTWLSQYRLEWAILSQHKQEWVFLSQHRLERAFLIHHRLQWAPESKSRLNRTFLKHFWQANSPSSQTLFKNITKLSTRTFEKYSQGHDNSKKNFKSKKKIEKISTNK